MPNKSCLKYYGSKKSQPFCNDNQCGYGKKGLCEIVINFEKELWEQSEKKYSYNRATSGLHEETDLKAINDILESIHKPKTVESFKGKNGNQLKRFLSQIAKHKYADIYKRFKTSKFCSLEINKIYKIRQNLKKENPPIIISDPIFYKIEDISSIVHSRITLKMKLKEILKSHKDANKIVDLLVKCCRQTLFVNLNTKIEDEKIDENDPYRIIPIEKSNPDSLFENKENKRKINMIRESILQNNDIDIVRFAKWYNYLEEDPSKKDKEIADLMNINYTTLRQSKKRAKSKLIHKEIVGV